MAGKQQRVEKPDIEIELPMDFAASMARFGKKYQPTLRLHVMHRTSTLEMFLRSTSKTSYCQFTIKMGTNQCALRVFNESAILEEETKIDLSADECVRVMTGLRSCGSMLRIGYKATWAHVRLEGGDPIKKKHAEQQQQEEQENGKGKKRTASSGGVSKGGDWNSRIEVHMGRVTDATPEMAIRNKPMKRFIVRIDQNYLLRRLTQLKGMMANKQIVNIGFVTERRKIVHSIPHVDAPMDDDSEDEETRKLRANLGMLGEEPKGDSTLEHNVIVPTFLLLTITAPGSSLLIKEKMPIVDRRSDLGDGIAMPDRRGEAANTQKGLGWREGDQDDAENAIEKKKDSELGINNAEASEAELFAYPIDAEEEPESFTYSVENLMRHLNSTKFSRYATLQWTDLHRPKEGMMKGSLWMCSQLDVGEGSITGLCACYVSDKQ